MEGRALVANKKRLLFASAVFAGLLLGALFFIAPHSVSASGGGGGSGGVGGCSSNCGGPYSAYGYGWYKFNVNSPGPKKWKDNSQTWGSASSLCRATGNDTVIAFIVQQSDQSPYDAWVYNDDSTYTGSLYKGFAGGNWITRETARALYSQIPQIYGQFGVNLGWFCYNFSKNWTINGQSYIQVTSPGGGANVNARQRGTVAAAPGDNLYWWHDLRNNGPDPMDKFINYYISKGGFSNGWNGIQSPSGSAWTPAVANQQGALFVKIYAPGAPYTGYTVQQADVGNTLCENISWAPGSSSSSGTSSSISACAAIPFNYTLVPQITNITNDTTIEGGVNNIPINGLVANNGPTRSQPNIQWQLTKIVYKAGVTLTNTAGGVSTNDPCTYYARSYGANATCSSLQSGTAAGGYANGARTPYNTNDNVADLPVGTQLCYVMSVKPNASSSPDWRHSQLYCLIVAKKPKVEVLGSDLVVGSLLNGATSTPSNVITSSTVKSVNGTQKQYGSWVEYGMFVMGNVQGLASAAGYAGGATPDPSLCQFSLLSFTNQPASGPCVDTKIGSYTSTAPSPQVASRFPITASTPKISGNVNLDSLAGKTTYTTDNGATITLNSGSSVPAGKWVVINAPTATVVIKSDITYTTSTLHSLSDLPQVVIIAKNIIVNDSVRQLDSWLVAVGTGADGRLNTCGASNDNSITEATLPNAGQCNQPLQINGPVIVNHLIMRRTAGSGIGAQSGDPAEVFNLRADAYLWATSYSPGSSRVPEASTKELPPRF